MKNSNAIKDAALGMPHGTAGNKLRKSIIFEFAQRLGLTECFKCGILIESVEDLTIEHKKPWLYSDDPVGLFFDLDNIAFSHLKCNRPHTSSGGRAKRKIGPEGTAWCSTHQKFLPIEQFGTVSSRWDGVRAFCKDCYNEARREGRRKK